MGEKEKKVELKAYKPVLLMILDGWGVREMEHGNAILQGNTPNYDKWTRTRERALLGASERAVGLIDDQMGNSEVGHLNLGAGRVVMQDILRVTHAIEDGSFFEMEALVNAMNKAKTEGVKVHYIGLLGTGGVHALDQHEFALLELAKQHGVNPIIHVITDGRDTPQESGKGFIQDLTDKMDELGTGMIASVSGRYYAMDRNKKWDRTNLAFETIAHHRSKYRARTPKEAILNYYANPTSDSEKGDEFVLPTIIETDENVKIESGDIIICFNFRADRMRQIVQFFLCEEIEGASYEAVSNLDILTMTMYQEKFDVTVLFKKQFVEKPLAQVLSEAGKKQFHIAETEKYPHVTYFFNGGQEDPFDGEDRTIVPSPKVATYDLKPEMSAYEVKDTIVKRIEEGDDDFLLINFANPDMVGHTGSLEAAIKAIEAVDECAGKVVDAVLKKGGAVIVTADHGNADRMIDEVTGKPHTYHTTAAVPLFVLANEYIGLRPRGILADVAPTVLHLLGMKKPEVMTGRTLVRFKL